MRFRGEAVAVIAGERDAIADLESADFPWHGPPLPHVLAPGEATADGAMLLHPSRPGNVLVERRGRARRP